VKGTAIEDVQHRLRARLAAQGSHFPLARQVRAAVDEGSPLLGRTARERLTTEVLAHVSGLGPLQPLLDDPEVTDILVNGPGRSVWVERSGALEEVDCQLDEQQIGHATEKAVAPLGLRVDRSSPLVDARLPDGSRVNAVVPPLAVDGPCLTIRRFSARAVPLESFAPASVVALLVWAVQARLGIVVSGGTGAGKTTLLNALAAHIPASERVVSIEDTAELRLPGHVVRLEARPANAEGVGEVGMRALVRNALRCGPTASWSARSAAPRRSTCCRR
jgi:pilus assembly protein CpaF